MTKVMIAKLFIDHPRAIGETYSQHARTAFSFGWRMTVGGLACMVHAVVPGLFAVGRVASSLARERYCSGISLGEGTFFGRVAATA